MNAGRPLAIAATWCALLVAGCDPAAPPDPVEAGVDAGLDAEAGDAAPRPDGQAADGALDDAGSIDAALDAPLDAGCAGSTCGGECVDLSSDVRHCGACDVDCTTLPGVDPGRARCVAGDCDLSSACADGLAHCTPDPGDGCETDATTTTDCGACGRACVEPTPYCAALTDGSYACASGCDPALTRCSGACVDTSSNPLHCGGCELSCTAPPGAISTCSAGACGFVCDGGAHRCGDECRLDTDPAACGAGCSVCASPARGTATCVAGACSFTCETGWHACGTGCVADDDPAACGASCAVCTAPANGSGVCRGGACDFVCDPGYVRSGATCVRVPRPIAPLSTSVATSRQPTLRWQNASGTDGAHVEVCLDRACASIVVSADVVGTSFTPGAPLPAGTVYWRLAGRSAGATVTGFGPTWQLGIGTRSAATSAAWGSILDVNGDGAADVAVGARGAERAYVYHGGATGTPTTASVTLAPPVGETGWEFGYAVASAGDVDGDGYGDLVVGARALAASAGPSSSGRAYVYLGGPTGIATSPSITLVGPDGPRGGFGAAVASAGDVDGDGYGDIVIGAPAAPYDESLGAGAGRAYVFRGGPGGPSSRTIATIDHGGTRFDSFAVALASGDVNGDGYGDVVIGAPGAGTSTGRVYVHLGSASGVALAPSATLATGAPSIDYLGGAVATADLDGDGVADVVAGGTGGTFGAGRVLIFRGGASGVATAATTTLIAPDRGNFGASVADAGDVDRDGFTDLAVGAPQARTDGRAYLYRGGAGGVAATPTSTLVAPEADTFGIAIAGRGDVNLDGYADVIVGAYRAPVSTTRLGRAYVYPGGATGLSAAPATTLSGPSALSSFGLTVARREPPTPARSEGDVGSTAG